MRELPHNLEAERTLLGAVLANPELFDQVVAAVTAPQFSRDAHRRIFGAMAALDERGDPIDLVTLKAELQRESALEAVGGSVYLAGLVDGLPRITSVDHWAQLVADASRRRALIRIGQELVQESHEGTLTTAEIAEKLRTRMDRVLSANSELLQMPTVVKEALADLETSAAAKGMTGVSWGLRDLDRVTSGLQPGQLVVVGARTSMGKTALAGQVELTAARDHGRVVGFSLEMPPRAVVQRLLLQDGGVPRWRLHAGGDVGQEAWHRVTSAAGRLAGLPIDWDKSEAPTLAQIRARAKAAAARGDLALVCVDYFQRIRTESRPERWAALGQVARGLKSLALELNIPVLLPAQLNRDAETRRPCLADLRECGDLEQEADVVLLLHRDRDCAEQVVPTIVDVAKNRNGPTERVTVGFHKAVFSFVNMADDEEDVA